MPEIPTQSVAGTWSVPKCPFTIEYEPRVLDDIRLAIMDAFFSLPRGGAEIGGILLGSHTQDQVTITDYVAMDCEHATGPSFVLSPRDETNLQTLLNQAQSNPDGIQPVGWYHSHTRSEIFLSAADQEIHNRFFPESWQVALVFRPHTFQPTRCGFFFREPDGSMQVTASYQEFVLEALPLRPVPTGVVPPMLAGDQPALHREPNGTESVINIPAENPLLRKVDAAASEQPPSAAAAPVMDVPKFAMSAPAQRPWWWLKVAGALAGGLAIGSLGFQTGQIWLPRMLASWHSKANVAAAAPLELSTSDLDGQLQIRWNRSSPVVQNGTAAILTINDEGQPGREIHLNPEHLKTGVFTYARTGEQVNVSLAIGQPNGPPARAVADFIGKAPSKPVPAAVNSDAQKLADAQIVKLKSDLAAQMAHVQKLEKSLAEAQEQASNAAKLRKGLAAANDRNKKLARQLADAETELKRQQRLRLGAQDSGAVK